MNNKTNEIIKQYKKIPKINDNASSILMFIFSIIVVLMILNILLATYLCARN